MDGELDWDLGLWNVRRRALVLAERCGGGLHEVGKLCWRAIALFFLRDGMECVCDVDVDV